MSAPEAEFLGIFQDEANERLDSMVEALLAVERGTADADVIDSLFRDAHTIKGAAGMLELEDVRTVAHALEDVPAIARDAGVFPPTLAAPLLQATDVLRAQVRGETVAPDAILLELHASKTHVLEPPTLAPADEPSVDTDRVEPPQESEPAVGNTQTAERRGVRVPAEKLDKLIDLVGETVVHRQRLEHALSGLDPARREAFSDELYLGDRLLGELQDAALDTRTLPLGSITGPLPRAVRDIAAAEGKDVELVVTGADVELDRVILETLSEPLAHLLRNSIAHGIELPADRERNGKPARGRVLIGAEQRGSLVAISVSDDGRGVSDNVLAEVARGGSLVDILTRSGFSTSERVSELAGRGVGLDAVKRHVESLRGELEITSTPHVGTTITLLLPMTLALLEVLLVRRGPHIFGLPLASVQEAVAVTQTLSLTGRTSIDLRGESIPLADLADLVGADAPPPAANPPALVVAASGRRVAAVCDSFIGEEEIVVKSLGPLLSSVSGYLGAAILGNGRIALLVDPNALVRATARRRTRTAVSNGTAETVAPKLLVVEDSFTVRELQRSILEAAGYRVETARNGKVALERLNSEDGFSLVVTDVEMPELDGLSLTRAIRAQPELSSLPVIVVTSRASDEDRERGIAAGADAYMVKRSYDQQALLGTVERLIGT